MDTNNQIDNIFNINIDEEATQHLKMACFWARLVAILGFIGAGISIAASIFRGVRYGMAVAVGSLMGSLIGAAISIALYTLLIRFAINTSASLLNRKQEQFDAGIGNLRAYFKMAGILLIIALSLIILGGILFVLVFSIRGFR